MLLIVALAACACADTSEEGSAARTATIVATSTTTTPRDTAAASPIVTSEQVSPSPTATSPSPTARATPHADQQAQVTRVVDGDTIEVLVAGATYKVRYIGVDTPETVDPRRPVGCFGREASERNRQLVEGKTVALEKDVSETDDFGRLLRYVWADGEMVNATLVREGYAVASTYQPDVKYQELFRNLQQEARDAGLGLWGPACASPTAAAAIPGACDFSGTDQPAIKGNISQSTGEKIYHVPGGEFYDKTVIDEAAGERWFCTEEDAVAAGWRRSKR
ncbi:MAG TPA: thermonuclease family protein [Dehalococcoidia bacterium]|nr:thermonuclease family protein [Dehalococcoidia bacterium]